MKTSRFFNAMRYAVNGLVYTVRTQPNMQFHLFAAAVALLLSLFLLRTPVEWALILTAIALVWISELINTSIEAMVDLLSPEIQERAKVAKDVAAGAVLVASLVAVGIGLAIFGSNLQRVWVILLEPSSG